VKHLGKNLKLLRKGLNITQAELGLQLNKRQTTIANWENGESEPNIDELIQLTRIFGITVDELILSELSKGKPIEKGEDEQETAKSKAKGNVTGKLLEQKEASEGGENEGKAKQDAALWYLLQVVKEIRHDTYEILARIDKRPK
jgi:transcriptional regulator with XRE-family HTH domain